MMSYDLAPQIEAIIVMDTNGNRLCAKYYSNTQEFCTKQAQTKFENAILSKANNAIQRQDSMLINYCYVCLYISCRLFDIHTS